MSTIKLMFSMLSGLIYIYHKLILNRNTVIFQFAARKIKQGAIKTRRCSFWYDRMRETSSHRLQVNTTMVSVET